LGNYKGILKTFYLNACYNCLQADPDIVSKRDAESPMSWSGWSKGGKQDPKMQHTLLTKLQTLQTQSRKHQHQHYNIKNSQRLKHRA